MIVITAPLKSPRIPKNYEKLYWLIVYKKRLAVVMVNFICMQGAQFSPRSFEFVLMRVVCSFMRALYA